MRLVSVHALVGEAICGNWRLLRCEGRCIANSSICNGVKDCLDGADETDCPMPGSCHEWYQAGYTESGAYGIGRITVSQIALSGICIIRVIQTPVSII